MTNETLTSSCKTGVRIAARGLEDEVRSLRLMLLNIREWRCKLLVGSDGLVERLVEGRFTLAITVNREEIFSEVPFEGRRVNESAAIRP